MLTRHRLFAAKCQSWGEGQRAWKSPCQLVPGCGSAAPPTTRSTSDRIPKRDQHAGYRAIRIREASSRGKEVPRPLTGGPESLVSMRTGARRWATRGACTARVSRTPEENNRCRDMADVTVPAKEALTAAMPNVLQDVVLVLVTPRAATSLFGRARANTNCRRPSEY